MAAIVMPVGAHKTTVDFDRRSQFSRYKTYAWEQATDPQSIETTFPNQLMRQRIAASIEEALAARGYKRAGSNPDLLLSYNLAVTQEPVYTTIGDGWGWGWNGGVSTTRLDVIYHSTLIVDLRDARHKQLVFQGVSTHTLASKPSKNSKKLVEAVDQIFEKYPPQL
jgi:hypothetical protein